MQSVHVQLILYGLTEHNNDTICQRLRAVLHEKKYEWDKYLGAVVYAMNTAYNPSVGYSPYFLDHGRNPIRSFKEIVTSAQSVGTYSQYAKSIADGLKDVWSTLRESISTRDQQVPQYQIGDQVLIKEPHVEYDASRKVQMNWIGPYTVIGVRNAFAYEVKSNDETGRVLVLNYRSIKRYVSREVTVNDNVSIEQNKDTQAMSDS